MRIRAFLICIAASAAALGQEPPKPTFVLPKENALPAWTKYIYGHVKGILLRSAEKMPEGDYGFKPAEGVRTYGQIIGHIADAQYGFCSMALGEKSPSPQIEKTKASKADLIAALKEAFTYCDKAYDGMTDALAVQPVTMFGAETPRLGVLIVNTTHSIEHYGNLVTYLRMKNIVPPTSEPGVMPTPRK